VQDAAEWRNSATEHAGSWWTHWVDWLKPLSGNLIPTTMQRRNTPPSLTRKAPGEYVLKDSLI